MLNGNTGTCIFIDAELDSLSSSSSSREDDTIKDPPLNSQRLNVRLLEPRFSQQNVLKFTNRKAMNLLQVQQDPNAPSFIRRGSWQHIGAEGFLKELGEETQPEPDPVILQLPIKSYQFK